MGDVGLDPFTDAEARQFLAARGITEPATVEVMLALSGRLPMWLTALAGVSPCSPDSLGDPAGDVVDRFLKWAKDDARRSVAISAALPRTFNQDVVAVLDATGQAPGLFKLH